jgi:hypothetical protein
MIQAPTSLRYLEAAAQHMCMKAARPGHVLSVCPRHEVTTTNAAQHAPGVAVGDQVVCAVKAIVECNTALNAAA